MWVQRISILGLFCLLCCAKYDAQSSLLVLGLLSGSPASCTTSSSWQRQIKLTFNNSAQATNLDNFPVLVVLNANRVPYCMIQAQGQDLRFFDSDGTTSLDYEIEKFDSSGSSLIWVRVPKVDASSATDFIYMRYGNTVAADAQNKTGVWSSGYRAVYHFASSFTDSTSSANNGADLATTSLATGFIGSGRNFLTTSNSSVTNGVTGYSAATGTIEAWARASILPGAGTRKYIFSHRVGSTDTRIYLYSLNATGDFRFGMGNLFDVSCGACNSTGVQLTVGQWNYLGLTWNGGAFAVYANGSPTPTNPTGTYANFGAIDTNSFLGSFKNAGENWDGLIDEVRVTNTVKPAAYFSAQYLSMRDVFITYGAEEQF
ncbi:MAG: DUF2341 domain-containing protein [Spirochaetia bacterium]|nr:DUF2341 domain-containing protein [Spirochaetia bacterium]